MALALKINYQNDVVIVGFPGHSYFPDDWHLLAEKNYLHWIVSFRYWFQIETVEQAQEVLQDLIIFQSYIDAYPSPWYERIEKHLTGMITALQDAIDHWLEVISILAG